MSLTPINPATCPSCSSKKTVRGGYAEKHKGSVWKCQKCETKFIVRTLVMRPAT